MKGLQAGDGFVCCVGEWDHTANVLCVSVFLTCSLHIFLLCVCACVAVCVCARAHVGVSECVCVSLSVSVFRD